MQDKRDIYGYTVGLYIMPDRSYLAGKVFLAEVYRADLICIIFRASNKIYEG